MKVRNMRSPRTGIEVANQFITEYGGQTIFQSYDVIIASQLPPPNASAFEVGA